MGGKLSGVVAERARRIRRHVGLVSPAQLGPAVHPPFQQGAHARSDLNSRNGAAPARRSAAYPTAVTIDSAVRCRRAVVSSASSRLRAGAVSARTRDSRDSANGTDSREHVALPGALLLDGDRFLDRPQRGLVVALQRRRQGARGGAADTDALAGLLGLGELIEGWLDLVEAPLQHADQRDVGGQRLQVAGVLAAGGDDRIGVGGQVERLAQAAAQRLLPVPFGQRVQHSERVRLRQERPVLRLRRGGHEVEAPGYGRVAEPGGRALRLLLPEVPVVGATLRLKRRPEALQQAGPLRLQGEPRRPRRRRRHVVHSTQPETARRAATARRTPSPHHCHGEVPPLETHVALRSMRARSRAS